MALASLTSANTLQSWRLRVNDVITGKADQTTPNTSGLFSHTGRMTISTNLSVTGNTSTNKATVTSAFTVSGNTTLGASGKTQTSTGAWAHTGTKTISTNLTVSGNTQIASLGIGTAASGTSGEIRATNNVTAYYSDERLKEILGTITNALEKIEFLSGVIYKNNERAKQYGYTNDEEQVGVIAQQVEQVLPQVVKSAPFDIGMNSDGTEYSLSGENYKTVQYEKLIPLIIEAIKELSARVKELENK